MRIHPNYFFEYSPLKIDSHEGFLLKLKGSFASGVCLLRSLVVVKSESHSSREVAIVIEIDNVFLKLW